VIHPACLGQGGLRIYRNQSCRRGEPQGPIRALRPIVPGDDLLILRLLQESSNAFGLDAR
jgi:hypothetical protein